MSVGIHPCEDLETLNSATVERLTELASDEKAVWAIGETGLDYYWSDENKQAQKDSLARHIHASQHLKKPLIVHTREAKADTLDILQSERQSMPSSIVSPKIGIPPTALTLGSTSPFPALSALKMLKPCERAWVRAPAYRDSYRDRQSLSCPQQNGANPTNCRCALRH